MIPVKKNMYYTVTAVDLTHEGLGVAKIDGYPIFVENLLPDEIADIKVIKTTKSHGYGKVEKLIKQSDDRVEMIDKKGTWVGTMPLQHLKYGAQLTFKTNQVKKVMAKIAKLPDVPVYDTIGAQHTTGYRNKAQIPVRMVDGQLETGFFRKNTHSLVPISNFVIQDKIIDKVILFLRDVMRRFGMIAYDEITHSGDIRNIVVRRGRKTGQIQVVFVTRTKKALPVDFVSEIIEAFNDIVSIVQNINPDKTNVIMGKTNIVLYGKDSIVDELLGKQYEISSKSFYQVNPEQTEILYQEAIKSADLSKDDVVIDAYCGIGTIGLSLADKVKAVYGMEIISDAIEMAKRNAEMNHITNAHFEVGDAKDIMPKWMDVSPNVVIVDPPRKGLTSSFIETTIQMAPEKIVYISCNPATMARDLVQFTNADYKVQYVQPVDMFPYTSHVECVTLLTKK